MLKKILLPLLLAAPLCAQPVQSVQDALVADALADALLGEIAPGDLVVCLGAGDITKWAAGLAPAITARKGGAA